MKITQYKVQYKVGKFLGLKRKLQQAMQAIAIRQCYNMYSRRNKDILYTIFIVQEAWHKMIKFKSACKEVFKIEIVTISI